MTIVSIVVLLGMVAMAEALDTIPPDPDPTPTSVPEPATLLLLGFGLAGLAGIRRKYKS